MLIRKPFPLYATIALLSGLGAACSDQDPTGGAAASGGLGAQSQAVQNGDEQDPTAYAMTYNTDNGKQCSGTIIQKLDGWTAVLTARECVTSNGTPQGPLSAGTSLYVNVWGWAQSAWLDAGPAVQDCAHNVAVIWLNWEAGTPSRIGMCLGTGSRPSSLDFWGFGSDGVLRRATSFSVSSWTNSLDFDAYITNNAGTSASGAGAAKMVAASNWSSVGDEGAPGFVWPSGSSAPVIAGIGGGISTSIVCGAAAPGFAKFLQDALYFYFVSSFANSSYNLCANGEPPADGGWLYGRCAADGATRSRVGWYPDTKELKFWNTNLCLQPDSGWVRIVACNGSNAQKWTVAHDSTCAITMKNVESDQCINDTGDWPTMGSCDASAKYLWHTQP
jgi:hypothetical protein